MRTLPLPRVVEDAALGLAVGGLTLLTSRGLDFEARREAFERGGYRPYRDGVGPPGRGVGWGAISGPEVGAVVALVVVLAFRRSAPRAAYLGVAAAVTVYLAAGGPSWLVLLGPALAVHTLMTRLPPRQWAPLLLALPVVLWARYWHEPYLGLADPELYFWAVLGTAALLLPGLAALVLLERREAQRTDQAAERRRQAYEERLQIAREVHDVVGHSLAVINMQAGVALHVLQKRPDQLAPSLEAIRTTSKTALAELGSTLATLRGDGAPAGAPALAGAPPPAGLTGLDNLVGALQVAGRTVRYRRPAADELQLPVTVQHAALRIAQEALTNVVRHASPEADIDLTLVRQGPVLVVEVVDDGEPVRPAAEGSGVTGMRERARAVGGRVVVGPQPGGGFRVRAELPVDGRGPVA